ncbi:PHP domain-containing protein [Nocardioides daeguensis]|uniref:Histidinol-phosphatase n=1 Tax=Nocardioides daeguensis TaxID=908359 RepID=A0ABP6UT81_9ACTN|nr:PHP domain-containing protein [Nocardioides daeguensis]MBV6728691.1 PHP domain-containing protein [Nocardioides daeguensis]MCR1773700.1 PHP domain-containing protein [Nocardioides daeguensis]
MTPTPRLPGDDHVHSQWSWDTTAGDMNAACARAVRLGLPSIAFTEHVDHTAWAVDDVAALPQDWTRHGVVEGTLRPPPFDVEGYLASVERCRARYPSLTVLTGVELGEPHWHAPAVSALLSSGSFARVLASVHSAPVAAGHVDSSQHYAHVPPAAVVEGYLDEVARLVTSYDDFQVLAHLDYPLRAWPQHVPFDAHDFGEHYRHVLTLLRERGKVLEVNTRLPMPRILLQWWHELGGEAISFASDAHRPELVASGFRDAVAMAELVGFRAPADPLAFWHR